MMEVYCCIGKGMFREVIVNATCPILLDKLGIFLITLFYSYHSSLHLHLCGRHLLPSIFTLLYYQGSTSADNVL